MTLNIAAVSFLNTIPLVEWFVRNQTLDVELTKALPSELSSLLISGEADIALLPIVEVFRGKGEGILSGSCIGCLGAVDSVKLFLSGSLEDLTLVKADRGSRSSVALLKILLAEKLKKIPDFQEIRPEPGKLPLPGEGILVIGDLCFEYERALAENAGISVFDLGQMWQDLTGLPFVFAVWAVAPGWPQKVGPEGVAQVSEMLNTAREFGLSVLPELVKREAAAGRMGYGGEATPRAIDYYFRHSLNYLLADEQVEGIREFHRLCVKHELVPNSPLPPIL